MRLDKYLADMTPYSRKEIKTILKQKRVTINDQVQRDAKTQVQPDDVVTLDGVVQHYQTFFYYEMHKPAGVLSATEDRQETTVLDLLQDADYRTDLFPVGRLDKDTTGLLVLTNDGQLAHRLLSPKKHVTKCYEATVDGLITAQDQQRFAQGIQLSDFKTQPAKLTVIKTTETRSVVEVEITEGKFHQIKRMFGALEKPVLTLKRLKMGQLSLDPELEPGAYRPLTTAELEALQTKA